MNKILIVEDETIVARDIGYQLQQLNYDPVASTETGEESLLLADRLRPDLVLMDIQLAGAMDGIIAAQTIRERFDIPVVFLTAFAGDGSLERAKLTEPFGYIVKPFEQRDLQIVLSMALYKHKADKEMRAANQQLRANEERFNQLAKQSRTGIWEVDTEGIYTYCSEIFADLAGYPLEDIVGKKRFYDLHPEHGREVFKVTALEVFSRKDSFRNVENPIQTKDGRTIWVSTNGIPVLHNDGRLLGYQGSDTDITQRKRADESLQKSENLYHSLVDNIPQYILRKDKDGRFTFANKSFCRLIGKSPEEILGKTDFDFYPANLAEEYLNDDRHVLETKKAFDTEEVNILPTGEHRYVHAIKIPIDDPNGESVGVQCVFEDITERKRAEEALMQERKFLRRVIDAAPSFVCVKDREGRFLMANQALATFFGTTVACVEGHLETELNSNALQVSQFQRDDREAMDTCQIKFIPDESVTYANGQIHWLATHKVPLIDERGGCSKVLNVTTDITERKRAETAMRESEGKYRCLFESSHDAIMILESPDWRFTSGNPAAVKMFGAKNEQDFISYGPWELSPEWQPCGHASAEKAIDMIETAMREGSHFFEWTHRRIGGDEFSASVLLTRMKLEGKAMLQATVRDITERKRAEAQIKKLTSAVEQSPASIVITDLTGAIEYVNPKFTQVSGYTLSEVRGQNPRILKSDNVCTDEYHQLWECITHGREWRGEFHNRKKNGDFYWESASISPIIDADGRVTHFLTVKEDITERKILEEQLRQAQKLDSIGQLAGGVAHDFNNILAAIMMRLDFLQQNPSFDEETQKSLAELTVAAKRAARLTRQLLIFSRKSILDVKVLDLNEVVANLLNMLDRLIGEHITVRFDRRAALPAVEADAGMLEQVVMNLAVNARDAMPQGGRITISIEPVQIDEEQVKGNIKMRIGQFVCLSVIDTGCGMDETTLQRIFEPFFTTKEVGKGTGLGLATVHGIITQHKGWVNVESELGKGTTFKVFLPAIAQGRAEQTTIEKTPVVRGHETILLVEDEASLRRLVAQGLRQMGYSVLEADNGQTAMKLWQEHGQQIDLLFSDMVMPEGMTGLDLAEKFKQAKTNLKIIISSGYNVEMAGHGKPTSGGIVYFQKPYEFEVLSKTVRDCLDRA